MLARRLKIELDEGGREGGREEKYPSSTMCDSTSSMAWARASKYSWREGGREEGREE